MQPQDQAPATKADLREFATKTDLRTMRDEIIVALKSEIVGPVREEIISSVRKEMHGPLRDEIIGAVRGELRGTVREMIHPVVVELSHLKADVSDIRAYIKDKLVTRDEFHSRMDDHEGRIKALEDERRSS